MAGTAVLPFQCRTISSAEEGVHGRKLKLMCLVEAVLRRVIKKECI